MRDDEYRKALAARLLAPRERRDMSRCFAVCASAFLNSTVTGR